MIPAQKTFYAKTRHIIRVASVALAIVIVRLFYLQVQMGEFFLEKSKNNFTRHESLLSLRGNILDRYGKILATNKPVTNIFWNGSGNAKLTEEQQKTIADIGLLLERPLEERIAPVTVAEKRFQKVALASDITFEQLSKIVERFSTDPNIKIETQFKRYYPYKSLASHLLGYLGYLGNSLGGKMGLEKLFEPTLRGKEGALTRIINSVGSLLAEYKTEDTFSGQDLHTTIDLSLQIIAERAFPEDKSGILILMDPHDGSLRVVLSRPNFDPNIFTNQLDSQQWQQVQSQKPFLNRICKASYPPGSTFKLVTLSAALETKVIDQYSTWNCIGYVTFAGRKYRCARKSGHGELTTKQALAHSCNKLFFETAKHLDIDIIAKYAEIFGLGKPTNMPLGENTGLVPSREWKRRVKGERWWLGETLSASIGQSFLLVTPLQVARMIGAIETGYLVSTRLLENTVPEYEPLQITYETRAFLRQAMQAVVTIGTGRTLSRLDDFVIRAKTSTAQTSDLSKKEESDEFLEHGWFACNFSFRGDRPLTLVVLTEKTGGAKLPMIIAKEFLLNYKELMEVRQKRELEKLA